MVWYVFGMMGLGVAYLPAKVGTCHFWLMSFRHLAKNNSFIFHLITS